MDEARGSGRALFLRHQMEERRLVALYCSVGWSACVNGRWAC